MAHKEQIDFCKYVKSLHPDKFKNCDVLDIGSLDINGNNRYLFEDYMYTGVDLGPGKNVDVVSLGHLYRPDKQFDVVISTECFEHDKYWALTLMNCVDLTKSGGLFLFTCASTGRGEHGTTRMLDWASPYSHVEFNDYYMNLTELQVRPFLKGFDEEYFEYNPKFHDLFFYGIKR